LKLLWSLLARVQPVAPADAGISRRDLLTGAFLRRPAAPPPAAVRPAPPPMPLVRPPGALAEAAFLAACTRCGDCVRACPYGAVQLAPERLRGAAGTPIVTAAEEACRMCPDTPCITACGPAALRRAEGAPVPAIATARISSVDCLAHQGSTCSTCRERCPVEGAIALDGVRPRIVAEACTGCGLCQHACPAPRNAVLILPIERA
jgi:ferredoxin-type protein NapG